MHARDIILPRLTAGGSKNEKEIHGFLMVAAFILCMMPKSINAAELGFEDVKEGKFYYDAVQWAVENHITTGTSPSELLGN